MLWPFCRKHKMAFFFLSKLKQGRAVSDNPDNGHHSGSHHDASHGIFMTFFSEYLNKQGINGNGHDGQGAFSEVFGEAAPAGGTLLFQ